MGPRSLCGNLFLLSFRGAEGDEESRSALDTIQSEIPRCARNDSPNQVFTRTPWPSRGNENRRELSISVMRKPQRGDRSIGWRAGTLSPDHVRLNKAGFPPPDDD